MVRRSRLLQARFGVTFNAQTGESLALHELIVHTIQQQPYQRLPFSQFMALALYAPELGYYLREQPIWGREGDYVTSPEVSDLFAQALAAQCAPILRTMTSGAVVELGAGSGRLAASLLSALAAHEVFPGEYIIVEISPRLRARQQQWLQQTVPQWLDRVRWCEQVPEGFCGVVLANEVLDALPVDLFCYTERGIEQRYVALHDGALTTVDALAQEAEFTTAVERLKTVSSQWPLGYHSEVNSGLPRWLVELAARIQQGVLLFFDYGHARREYYAPTRPRGSLRCFYQHQVLDDPFLHLGTQDITADVDFTAVAEAAIAAGLEVAGYTPQGAFLAALLPADSAMDWAAKSLLLPQAMGGVFQVMALAKDFDAELQGFAALNLLSRL